MEVKMEAVILKEERKEMKLLKISASTHLRLKEGAKRRGMLLHRFAENTIETAMDLQDKMLAREADCQSEMH
jgi:hypothetical protein